jgi:hypothetical protein
MTLICCNYGHATFRFHIRPVLLRSYTTYDTNNHTCTLADATSPGTRLSILDHSIAARDLVNEGGLGIGKQNVKVLNGANALQ